MDEWDNVEFSFSLLACWISTTIHVDEKCQGFLSPYSWIAFHEVSNPPFLHPINIQLHCFKNNQKQQTKTHRIWTFSGKKKSPVCTCRNQTYLKLALAYVPVNSCKAVSFFSMLTLIQKPLFLIILDPWLFGSSNIFKIFVTFFFFCPSRF